MDGVEKAALLLFSLGEESSSEILKYLTPKQVQKLSTSMAKFSGIQQDSIDGAVTEFISETDKNGTLGINPSEFTRNVLNSALGSENASSFLDRIISVKSDSGLDRLRWLEPRAVADLIKEEHPQIIATILMYLDSEQAADILSCFDEKTRVGLIMRMSAIDAIKPQALSELGEIVETQLSGHKSSASSKLGGIKQVAEIINSLDGEAENKLMKDIDEQDKELCEEIKEKMFVFENLIDMDGRSMQRLLQDIPTDALMLALKGADEEMQEFIFSNMSKRAADLMRDDMEAKGPVKLSEVQAAQKEVLNITRKLADNGDINLGGKGGEEMV